MAKKAAKRAASRTKEKPASKVHAPQKRAKKSPGASPAGRIVVENVNVPGYRTSVDAAKYGAMRDTLLAILPKGAPGLTQAQMMEATKANAPRKVFPGGDKTEWWTKCVQLDLEAKRIVTRDAGKPLRWRRA